MEKVQISIAILEYGCKLTMKNYILIMSNAIYIPSVKNNIIPPFRMHESRILGNDVARIHCGEYVYH